MRNPSPEWLISLWSKSRKVGKPGSQPWAVSWQSLAFPHPQGAPGSHSKHHLLSIYYSSLHKDMKRSKEESLFPKANGTEIQCDQENALLRQQQQWAGREVLAGRPPGRRSSGEGVLSFREVVCIFHFPIEYGLVRPTVVCFLQHQNHDGLKDRDYVWLYFFYTF